MSKTTKIVIGVIIAIIVIGGIWYVASQKPATTEKSPIKIGAILPLTGSNSVYGEKEKNGLEMALAEINQAGGINGRPIEIVYEDSQGQSKEAVDAWERITLNRDIFLVVDTLSNICQVLSPLANQSKTVLLSSDCAVAKYSSPNDYTFRVLSSNAKEGEQMAKYLLQKILNQ